MIQKLSDQIRQIGERLGREAKQAMDGGVESLQGAYVDFTASLSDLSTDQQAALRRQVVRIRNRSAEHCQTLLEFSGLVTGVAGEVAMFSATGGLAYLVLAGAPLEASTALFTHLGKKAAEGISADRKAKFVGISSIKTEADANKISLRAVLYDPDHEAADEHGFFMLSELELFELYSQEQFYVQQEDERADEYIAALLSIQAELIRRGLPLSGMDIKRFAETAS